MASTMASGDLYYSQSYKIIIVNVVTLVVAIFAVLLRLVSRWLSAANFWWDDGLMIVGLILTFGSSAFNFVAADHGAGKHQEIVSKQDQAKLSQIIYGIEILYPMVVTAIKCSILMLYLRLFGVRLLFRKLIYGMLALVVGWCIAVVFAAIFQASPPKLLWTTNLNDLPKGYHHIDFPAYLIGSAVPNVVMDFAILLLPVSIVWQLQISMSRKMALSAVFAVGALYVLSLLWIFASPSEYPFTYLLSIQRLRRQHRPRLRRRHRLLHRPHLRLRQHLHLVRRRSQRRHNLRLPPRPPTRRPATLREPIQHPPRQQVRRRRKPSSVKRWRQERAKQRHWRRRRRRSGSRLQKAERGRGAGTDACAE